MADTTAHEAERQTDDANTVDTFARSQRGGVDRSTYWARWLTYWNIIRPTWPVFVAILFVWAVAFGTDQGREAVKFTMTLGVGGVGAAPDFVSWLFQDGMLRAYATAAALFMFSVGAHEVFWRATSRDYPFTRRALADLKARFMIGWFVGLSVPVSFFIFYLHHLADVASANVVVEMAGRSDVTQEARTEIIQDWRVNDDIVNAVLLGLIGLIAVSAIYDVINRPFRHLFVNAVRPVERVVLGAFPFIIGAIGILFFWNTFIAPLVSIVDSMSRGFELRALNISATQPARTGAFLTFGTIVLTGGLIRFMHRMSARRYYSNSHQFLVFRKIHNVSMWAALFVFFTVVALYAIKPAFLASLFGPVFTLLVIVGVLVLAFTLLAVYSSHTSGLPSIIMVAALMWVGPSFGSVKFHDLDVQRAYTRLSDDAKLELLSRLPEVNDKVGQDYIQQGVMPLEARVRDWRLADGRSDNHPAVVVLAEGGGIRAALHTASLLACLDEVYSGELYDNILVLSGVSGGAVGVSTYLAARADGLGTADAEQGAFCQFKANAQPTALTSSVQMNAAGVGQFLQSDFFSPALAGLIFRDFPMDIFPLCAIKQWCSKSDRAQMFERAFEDAYTKTRGDKGRLTNWFGAPFNVVIEEASQIQDGTAKHRLPQPIVLLNTFDAKSGHHAVVSNATFAADRNQPEKNLNGPVNILDYLAGETCEAPSTVSLATATHLSARFPLVSPPGRLPLDKCRTSQDAAQKRMGLYVDGGYYDNSGAASAQRVVEELRKQDKGACQDEAGNCERPIIVLHVIFRGLPTADTTPKKSSTDLSAFYEISAPAQAVLAARGVHGNVPVTRLCETAYMDAAQTNGCNMLNGWLADEELKLASIVKDPKSTSYGESVDWRAMMGGLRKERDMSLTFPKRANTPHLVWMRSPLQFAASAEDVDASLPLGWLLGESGAVILDRVNGHVSSLAEELGCYVAPSGDASGFVTDFDC